MKQVTYYESKAWDLLATHNAYCSFFWWFSRAHISSTLMEYLTKQAQHWLEELDEMDDLINTAINETFNQ